MSKQMYLNTQTGEIIETTSQFSAFIRFKQESEKLHYHLGYADVKPLK